MTQLTSFDRTEPNLLKVAVQTRKVERLQRALRDAVKELEGLLEQAENGRVGLPTEQANRPNRADISAQ